MGGVIALNVLAGIVIIALMASGAPVGTGVLLSLLFIILTGLTITYWRWCARVTRVGREAAGRAKIRYNKCPQCDARLLRYQVGRRTLFVHMPQAGQATWMDAGTQFADSLLMNWFAQMHWSKASPDRKSPV